jgi:hypothetical protein
MLFALTLFNQKSIKQPHRRSDKTMSRPITETPILTGQDAVRFIERAKNPTRATPEEKQAVKDAYMKFKLMSKDPTIF